MKEISSGLEIKKIAYSSGMIKAKAMQEPIKIGVVY